MSTSQYSFKILLDGAVDPSWNGAERTVIAAEAPEQEEVGSSSVSVNLTFFYCSAVSQRNIDVVTQAA